MPLHVHIPYGLHWQQQNNEVGQCVEQATGIEQHGNINAFAWKLRIENLGPWVTFEYLHKGGTRVEEDE